MSPYTLAISAFITAGALVGSFYTGYDYGKKTVQAKVDADVLGAWHDDFTKALNVAKDFQKIAADYIAKIDAQKATNKSRHDAAKAIINEHPLPATATLDPRLVQLRCLAIQDLYRAAGRPVPGSCVSVPAAASPAAEPAKG